MAARLSAILSGSARGISLNNRSKSVDCSFSNSLSLLAAQNGGGKLPDESCSPGAVFSDATIGRICVTGYSATVRSVSDKLRGAVFAEYGISYPPQRGAYEVDHIVPLSIGGSNDIANLFPQPADPMPGFREKDVVENYLHEGVCSGRVILNVAQEEIAKDWLAIYNNLSPDEIARIKAEYGNWSDSVSGAQ